MRKVGCLGLVVFLMAFLWGSTVWAQNLASCEGLTDKQNQELQTALKTSYAYDCCDESLDKCVKNSPDCTAVKYLSMQACRHAKAGKSADAIKRLLEQRADFMAEDALSAPVKPAKGFYWGNEKAKVELTIYLCGRCQFCSIHVPRLAKALEEKGLKEKVRINIQLFPIKSHAHSLESALALNAAAQQGKGWEFMVKMFEDYDGYKPEKHAEWVEALALDKAKFDADVASKAVLDKTRAAKIEGLKNGVEATPTFFIQGKKMTSPFDAMDIVEMLEESLEAKGP